MRVRKWLIASLLAAMLAGLLHYADRQVRWQREMSPQAFGEGGLILIALYVIGLSLIATRVLHLNESRLRDMIIGTALLAIPAAVVQVLGVFGVFEGSCLVARDAGPMLSTLPVLLLVMAVLTFAGVSMFRGIAYLRRRWHRARRA